MVARSPALAAPYRPWLAAMLVLVVAAYAVALPGPFQFDDLITVAVDPGAQSLAAWWADAAAHVRPLTKATFALTYPLGECLGNVPLGHRLGNLAIHLATIVAFYWLGRRVASSCVPQLDGAGSAHAALAAAALFGLHPLATEAVSYLSGRSMGLGTLLGTLSLVAWMRAREEPLHRGWLVAALAAWTGAVLARETALFAPFAWMLWEWARADRRSPAFSAERVRALAPFLALPVALALAAAIWLLAHDRYAYLVALSGRIARINLTEPSLLVALDYFARGFALLRYPSIDPDVDPHALSLGGRLAGMALLTIIALTAWRWRHARPHLMVGLAWAALWIAPVYLVAVRHDPVAERHFYPAIWGLALVLAVEWARLGARLGVIRAPGRALAVGCLVAMAGVTAVRNADYRSEVTLWEAAARGAPDRVRVLNNLGVAYKETGRFEDAERVLARAVALDPAHEQARDNLVDARRRERTPVVGVRMRE